MKHLLAAAVMAVSTLIVPATLAHAEGQGTQTATLTVFVPGTAGPIDRGGTGYVDTGFTLKAGLPVTLTASGSTFYCLGCPGGQANGNGPTSLYPRCSFVAPEVSAGALFALDGDSQPIFVGEGPTTIAGSGTLVLGINDCFFSDNSGGFYVAITYECQPGYGYGDKNHYHCGPPGQ